MSTRAIWIGSAAAATVVAVPLLTKMWQITMARRKMAASDDAPTGENSGIDGVVAETLKKNSGLETPVARAFQAAMEH